MRIFEKQKSVGGRVFSVDCNRTRKTMTIKEYDKGGRLSSVYRSYPMGADYSEIWTPNDITAFLRYSNNYYVVK